MLAYSGALVPGTLLTYAIAEGARRGASAGPLIVLGHGLLELVLIAGLALGILTFFSEPLFVRALSIGGGIIIGVMAVFMIRDRRISARAGSMMAAEEGDPPKRVLTILDHPIVGGAVMSAANPYWSLWWVGAVTAYAAQLRPYGLPGYIAFFSGHILADLTWYTLVTYAVATGRKILSERFYERLILASGAFLMALAAWFIWSGALRAA